MSAYQFLSNFPRKSDRGWSTLMLFFGKMICAYDSFERSKSETCRDGEMSARKSLDWGRTVSPTGAHCSTALALCNFFYCLCWWFSRKDFLRVNKYLSCAVRKTFFCRSSFFSPSTLFFLFFLMWKQIFNQEFFFSLRTFAFFSLFLPSPLHHKKAFAGENTNLRF